MAKATPSIQLGFFALADNELVVNPEIILGPTDSNVKQALRALFSELTGAKLSSARIFEICRAFGFDTHQDAYNLLEGALAQHAATPGFAFDDARAILDHFPQLAFRSEDRERYQQFSTPPTIALTMRRLASIDRDSDIVLEPSAGTGGLVASLAGLGNRLILNELDEARSAILAEIYPLAKRSRVDARYLEALISLDRRPSVVLMNPPFSNDVIGGQTKDRAIGIAHINQALRVLHDGGRLVALVGGNQHPQLISDEWESLLKESSLRLAVTIEGHAYAKMGTAFPTAIVVIDKSPNLPTIASNTTELAVTDLPLLPIIDRQPLAELPVEQTSLFALKPSVTARQTSVSVFTGYSPRFEDVQTFPYLYNPQPHTDESEKFVHYQPTLDIPGDTPHPATLVESMALGNIYPPKLDANDLPLRLPKHVFEQLSNLQLERILYIQNAWRKTYSVPIVTRDMETGERHQENIQMRGGYMVGDGTGVGKTRIICGAIISQMIDGRTRHIIFSPKEELLTTLRNEWKIVAGKNNDAAIVNLGEFPVNTDLSIKHGIVFCTYATLRTGSRNGSRSRLDQLLQWMGGDFQGIIAFDESHELANTLDSAGARGTAKASKQATAAHELQIKMPNARVLYLSATCASKIEAYAYAPRLGLWRANSAFLDRNQFLMEMQTGGTGALELLARDLKQRGLYSSASLSLAGINVERVVHKLDDNQIDGYNALAQAWRVIYDNLTELLDQRECSGRESLAARSAIASARLRSLQAYLGSASMPTVLERERQCLNDGYAIVGQIANTYESSQKAALAEVDEDTDLDSIDTSPIQIVYQYLDTAFPTRLMRTVIDPNTGNEISEPVLDHDGNEVDDPAAIAMRNQLKDRIADINVPDSILTIHLDTYGAHRVAEVTGRTSRLLRVEENGVYRRVLEKRAANANQADIDAFMGNDKDILVFSDSKGGTGLSYHSSLDCKNQRKRAHFLLQTPFSAEKAKQSLGRTDRSNQASKPDWFLCSTDAPGAARFVAVLARRLENLGAATMGQRDGASNDLFSADDNLESEYGQQAVRSIISSIYHNDSPLSKETFAAQTGIQITENDKGGLQPQVDVKRFLNLVLSCDLGHNHDGPQHLLMDAFFERFHDLIDIAKRTNTYDTGLQAIRARRIDIAKRVNLTRDTDGLEVDLLTLKVEKNTDPHKFSTAKAAITSAAQRYGCNSGEVGMTDDGEIAAWYRVQGLDSSGQPVALYAHLFPTHKSIEHAPLRFTSVYSLDTEAEATEADMQWNRKIDTAPTTHNETVYLVTGALLSIYHRLPKNLAKIVTVTTATGERLIGRILEANDASTLLEALGAKSLYEADEAFDEYFDRGKTIGCKNHWRFVYRTIGGQKERIIEFPAVDLYAWRAKLTALGCTAERNNYQWFFKLPAERASAKAVFTTIADQHQVVNVA